MERRLPRKPQPRRLARLAARFGRFAPCSAFVAVRRPRDCPFQSRPAPQPRTAPASTGGAAGTARRPPPVSLARSLAGRWPARGARHRNHKQNIVRLSGDCGRSARASERPEKGARREGDRREPSNASGEAASKRVRGRRRRARNARAAAEAGEARGAVAVRSGGVERGSREGDARRSKHHRERAPRATEERSKAREPSRLGLSDRSSRSYRSRDSLINHLQIHHAITYKPPIPPRERRTPAIDRRGGCIERPTAATNQVCDSFHESYTAGIMTLPLDLPIATAPFRSVACH